MTEQDHIVARELPVLLPTGEEQSDPIVGVSGIIDLVLREPETEELIVVDYKTDHIEDGQDLADHASHYAPQLSAYAEALRQAFDLEASPRTELWFVASDRVWRSS